MKILKSGIEMTPEEFRASRGGKTCACGCEGGFNTERLWVSADASHECLCGCTTPGEGWKSPVNSAQFYPY